MSEGTPSSNGKTVLSAEQLADRSRFKFRDTTLEIPEIGGSVVLKSLTVRERESLPDISDSDVMDTDDRGKRTKKAIKNSAIAFSIIVKEPDVTAEQAEEFLGDWPAEALDRITVAYRELVGNKEEAAAATAEFPEG